VNNKDTGSKRETFQPVRGTRDYYPDQTAVRNWLFAHWRQISRKHGFAEYDGPIFEHLDLYRIKSGSEIVSQLFSFEDRGGRELAIRPEITPTLARMIASKAASLPKPIKWFSIPRLCRAERPQRGRLREFFQWNIDIVGSDRVLADAECTFVALDLLRTIGLGPDVVELRVSSRTIISALLIQGGIDADRHEEVFGVMDKYEQLGRDQFREYAKEQNFSPDETAWLVEILQLPDLDETEKLVRTEQVRQEFDKLKQLQEYINKFGVGDYFKYRPGVVRGLAYYTGMVYEVFDRGSELRAIAGGGRYDDLIKLFGGPALPATGFGMGDVVLIELLTDLGKLPELPAHRPPDFFVIDAEKEMFDLAVEIVGRLRSAGFAAEFSYRRQSIAKQLKQADARSAKFAVILGAETRESNLVTVKNLSDGTQKRIELRKMISDPAKIAGGDNHATF